MKIASHVLLYNQDKWILQNIANSAPFVDKIYVSWSKLPWNYNKNARKTFTNQSKPEILDKSPYRDKIVLIKGVWDKDEDQRNACLAAAKADGMDYLLIHDADEFYTTADFKKIVDNIHKNPDFDYYTTPWITFWKNFNNVLAKSSGSIISGYPEVALNINSGNKFIRCRRPSGDKIYQMDALCHHASYVLSDKECWEKINTWGHAHQFNTKKWYDNKWKKWNKNTTNLHPISPKEWHKAVSYDKNLPEVLKK